MDELQKQMWGTTRSVVEGALEIREIACNEESTRLELIYEMNSGSSWLHFPSLERLDDYGASASGAMLIGVEDDSFSSITGDTDLQTCIKSIDTALSGISSWTDAILKDGSINMEGAFVCESNLEVQGVLDVDSINSDGGAFDFTTTGSVNFNNQIKTFTGVDGRITSFYGANDDGVRLSTFVNDAEEYASIYVRDDDDGVDPRYATIKIGHVTSDYLSVNGVTGDVMVSSLTASQAVFTDGTKNLVSNAITGTGDVVMSTKPTISSVFIPDDEKIQFGNVLDTEDASMQWSSSDSALLIAGNTIHSGQLHIKEGVSGATAVTSGDNFIIESDVISGMSLLFPDDSSGHIVFGSASDSSAAALAMTYSTGVFEIGTYMAGGSLELQTGNGSTRLTIDTDGDATFTHDVIVTGSLTVGADSIITDGTLGATVSGAPYVTLDGLTACRVQVNSSNILVCENTGTTLYGNVNHYGGTANYAMFLDSSKNVTYVNTTGTGNVVRAGSPVLTGSLAVGGRYDAGDGGALGAFESIDATAVDMVFVDPAGGSSMYYYLADGNYQGQRVTVINKNGSNGATINMTGSSTGAGSSIYITYTDSISFKWDVVDARWYPTS